MFNLSYICLYFERADLRSTHLEPRARAELGCNYSFEIYRIFYTWTEIIR